MSLVFASCPFSVSGSHPGYRITLSYHIPFRILLAGTLSQTFIFCDDHDSFEEYGLSILQNVLQLGFVWCFCSQLDEALLTLITWLRQYLSAFFTVIFFPFSYCTLQKEVTMYSPYLRSEELLCISLSSPSDFNLSQHQGLFQWVGSLHQVVKVLGLQLQYQSFQWIYRVDLSWDGLRQTQIVGHSNVKQWFS